MRLLIKLLLFLVLPAAVIGLPVAAAVFGVEREPLVQPQGRMAEADMRRAQAMAQRFDPRSMRAGRDTTVSASEADINTVFRGVLTADDRIRARARVAGDLGLVLAVTGALPVPENPLGRYVNLRLTIAPSDEGLVISRLAIGRIEVPPAFVRPALRFAIDRAIGDGKGDEMLASIRSVATRNQQITLRYRPPENLVADIKTASATLVSVADPELVRVYYGKIIDIAETRPGRGAVSFADYLGPMFALARTRSAGADPVAENRAALLALAIYFGDPRLERMVGPVRTEAMKAYKPRNGQTRLQNREDWVQHFIISAGLTLTGTSRFADIIGEAKEIADAGKKSGFSFTDLAADRAGVKLAEKSVASAASARAVQEKLGRQVAEADFFPRVADLPEGLSQAEFTRRYQKIDSPTYKSLVAEIDRRIMAIPVYRQPL